MMIFKSLIRIRAVIKNLANARPYYYLGNSQALARLWCGKWIYVDTSDRSVAPHLINSGQWEPGTTTAFLNHLPNAGVIFDCGANHGYFGLIAMAKSRCQVHFFEVNQKLANLIQASTITNGWGARARVNCLAVSNTSGSTVVISEPTDFKASARIGNLDHLQAHNTEIAINHRYKAHTIRIDDYCSSHAIEHIDLLKLDIEGHEEAALQGATRMIEGGHVQHLLMEYTHGAYGDGCLNFLKRHFAKTAIIESNGSLTPFSNLDELKLHNQELAMILCSLN